MKGYVIPYDKQPYRIIVVIVWGGVGITRFVWYIIRQLFIPSLKKLLLNVVPFDL